LYLEHISINQFKNFSSVELDLKPGFHFITGQNGSGKTNFLDALYYLCMTRSFLKQADKMLVRHDEDFFRLNAGFVSNDREHQLKIKFKLPGSKEIELDAKKYEKLTEHFGKLPVVVIAPDEVFTLMHGQEERRKFMNQTLIQSDHDYFDHLYAYNKLLKQRGAALKQMRKDSNLDNALLDAIDHIMIPHAIAIYNKRKDLIENLNPEITKYVRRISDDQQEGYMVYESEVNDNYQDTLMKSREKDYYTTQTNAGIHRDHLNCMLHSHLLNEIGSQGQVKSFVVAMKLAQFNYLRGHSGSTPLVLLDDIFAKLDANRVGKFLEILKAEDIDQCFLTDTHADRLSGLMKNLPGSAYLYQVNKGSISQL
jgi:DNA replication and repair protein RecF